MNLTQTMDLMADELAAAGNPGDAATLRATAAHLGELPTAAHTRAQLHDTLITIEQMARRAAQLVAAHTPGHPAAG